MAREVGVSEHTLLRLEGEVRRHGCEPGAGQAKQLRDENTKLRKLVADLSLDKEALQAVIRKNGWELVALKAAVEQVRGEYAFSQRRACGLMTMAV